MANYTIGSSTASENTGSATADYTSVSSWESAAASGDTGTCIASKVLESSYTTIDVTNLTLTADSGNAVTAPTTAACTSKARMSWAGWGFNVSATGFTIEKVGLIGPSSGSNYLIFANASGLTVRRCVFRYGTILQNVPNNTMTVDNCVFVTPTNYAVWDEGSTTTPTKSYHCSVLAGAGGYAFRGGQQFACIVQGSGTNYSASLSGSDENVSEDTSAPGTTYWRSQTSVFSNTTGGSEDLALAAGAQGDYGVTDRSGTVADLATDIAGTTRTGTIDAGVWQTPAATAASIPSSLLRRMYGTPLLRR